MASAKVGPGGGQVGPGGGQVGPDSGASTSANAEVATGTGSASGPSVSLASSAGAGSATGAASNASPTLSASTGAGTATGAAGGPSSSVAPTSGASSGSGFAYDATVSIEEAGSTNAPAGLASGTGAASGASASLAPNSGAGSGSGASGGPSSKVSPTSGVGSGTGSAFGPSRSSAPHAGLASGTGISRQPTAKISVSVGVATGTGAAYAPTISRDTSVHAGLASGVGTAYGPSIALLVDGVDPTTDPSAVRCTRFFLDEVDITDIVILKLTYVEASAQGKASTGVITVRDLGQETGTFVTGSRVRIDLGSGAPLYQGYLMNASRRFWFPVDDPDKLQRQWVLTVVDINILFSRRVVYNKSTPAKIAGPTYTHPSYDDDAIANLVNNWLDLSADDLDTSSLVDRVGAITMAAGQPTYPWQASMYFGEAMQTIAALPAGIFFIDPDRRLVYADVDVEDAPFVLSDVPGVPSNAIGYREASIEEIADLMVNDYLALGFGRGRAHGVFQREEDAASIALHDRWQDARVIFDIYKQATIDRHADAVVNGSPSSKRGRKDDRVQVKCVTFHHGLRVGQRVRFINSTHDYDDVIPIRTMRMVFPTPCDVRYELTMSHEYDAEWSLYDKIPVPRVPSPKPVYPVPPEIHDPPPPGGCDCGITDTFDRSVAGGTTTSASWGTSDSGIAWDAGATFSGLVNAASVDGSSGVLVWDSGSPQMVFPTASLLGVDPIDITLKFTVTGWTHGGSDGYAEYHLDLLDSGLSAVRSVTLAPGSDFGFSLANGFIETDDVAAIDFDWVPGQAYQVHIYYSASAGELNMNVWLDGDAEPAGWMIGSAYGPGDDPIGGGFRFRCFSQSGGFGTATSHVDDLDISGLDRCTRANFDTFTRVTEVPGDFGPTTGWGYSDWGLSWQSGGTELSYSNGQYGVVPLINPEFIDDMLMVKLASQTSPWDNGAFVFSFDFMFDAMKDAFISGAWFSAVGDPGPRPYVGFLIEVDNSFGLYYVYDSDNSTAEVAKTDWVVNTWYSVKFEYQPGVLVRMKLWERGTTEPDWTNTMAPALDIIYAGYDNTFDVNVQKDSGLPSVTTYFDNFNFTYAGQPCPGCGETPTDTFDRADQVDLGVSDSGHAWLTAAGTPAIVSNRAHFDPGDGAYLDYNPSLGMVDVLFDFELTAGNLQFLATVSSWGSVNVDAVADTVTSNREGITTSYVTESFSMSVDTVYRMRIVEDLTMMTVKIWEATDPEPSSELVINVQSYSGSDLPARASVGFYGLGTSDVYIDNLVISTECHETAGSGIASSGRLVCESPADTGDHRHFQLGNAFVLGSAQVFVDGLRKRNPTDYTEDPSGAQIIFGSPLTILQADSVYVCTLVDGGEA